MVLQVLVAQVEHLVPQVLPVQVELQEIVEQMVVQVHQVVVEVQELVVVQVLMDNQT